MTRRPAHLRSLSAFLLLGLLGALAGCGTGTFTPRTADPAQSLHLSGHVHGGMQPVVGATLQLYAAGNSGNGSQATPLLATPALTGTSGSFSLAGTYTCPSASTQVYAVARGGNPGFAGAVNNPALVLVAALGSCGNLGSTTSAIELNEVTTVAAAYALAPFLSSYDHLGASSTNALGLANAFLDAQLLANPATGLSPQLASNLGTETAKLYALADALAPCVNSTGTGSPCSALFAAATPSGGTAPGDVLAAVLSIIRNPGSNVGAVFSLIGSTPPWATSLTTAPHDWTMSLTVTGGGLAEPTVLAVDAGGNVWVTNYGGTQPTGLVAFSPQGAPFPGTPFQAGSNAAAVTDSYGLVIDNNGDVWVSSYDNRSGGNDTGSLSKFLGAASSTPGAFVGQFLDDSLSQPEALAADPASTGTILAENYHTGTVSFFRLDGSFQKVLGSDASQPDVVASDGLGGAWVGDQGSHQIHHFLSNGTQLDITCCNAVQSLKLDLHGNVWASNYSAVGNPATYTFSEISSSGTVLIYEQGGGGLFTPGAGAIDAGGNFWTTNYYGSGGSRYASFTEIAGNDGAPAAGTPLTPSTGLGQDALMSLAYAIVPDASGNLWVSVRNGNSLRMFFGLATPTATPAGPLPAAP